MLYRDPDFEAEALIPAFIGTTVSFCVFSVLMFLVTSHYAFDPLFVTPTGLTFDDPLLLAPLALLLAGLTVVVIDARFGAVGFAGLADAAVVEHVLLVHLLGQVNRIIVR